MDVFHSAQRKAGKIMQSVAFGNQMIERLSVIVAEQQASINVAALAVADALAGSHRVWIAETSHGLHDEVTFRAGGLMAVHRLSDPVGIERSDVVVIPTNAGTTHMTVDLALIANERGAATIALTPVDYEMDPRLSPEHSSGKRLSEVATIVVDLGGRYGDTELDFTSGDVSFSAIPGSGIAGMLAMWMIFAGATELLCERGAPPLIWDSMQMPGVHAANLERYAGYRHSRVGVATGSES
jgi:uncharacterized phosphosugar-binding protein